MKEASMHLNLYLEAMSGETDEEVLGRLERILSLLEGYPGLSIQIYESEIQHI